MERTLILQNVIRDVSEGLPKIIITTKSKVAVCGPLGTALTDAIRAEAQTLLKPPPAPKISVQEALSSPVKERHTVSGRILQVILTFEQAA